MSSSAKRIPSRGPSPLETLEVPEGYRRPEAKIENIVATVILDHPLDLNLIETRIPDVDYNPDQFPGLVYRLNNPKVTALIFKSGKMVVTGAKSVNQLVFAVKKIIKSLIDAGIPVRGVPKTQIQNIVASANLHVYVDLEAAAYSLEGSMYEPEQFPGLIYRMNDPTVVLLIFSSGKMVITGAKREIDVERAVANIYRKLWKEKCILGPAD
ncbi:MAG: TATA-box-binding protein [Desulfurococcales archaeon]|nr:TATA-box-binding protein [Desulfurococcales archaeon]MEB3764618.1 TATA-box-binding protein [Desulfurococcales archaeon]